METNNKECVDENFKEIEVNLSNQMLCTLHSHMEKVCDLFQVQFVEKRGGSESFDQSAVFALFGDDSRDSLALSQELKKYLENVSSVEAEDSSYDSECDNDEKQISPANLIHEKVSRTASDTLGQEFAEYVNNDDQQYTPLTQGSPGYNARVEFALKLGYTEKLVQTALTRLGPDPAQNELLAELIKLGAQQSPKGEYTPDADSAAGSRSASTFVQNVDANNSLSTQVSGPDESASNFLRPIVIDGSNVAMSHGNKEVFSCLGIKICVDWFKNRGHKDITVFVPKWRKENARLDNPIKDQDILNELERERMLVFTPSRLVGGKRMVCYDDRYILKLAADNDGIVVSNDNYRDLIQESSEFKKVVEERVLMYSFVNDRFMPPDDPLGRSGPTLDNFLRMQPKKSDPPPPCPYGKKCTYGNKCKFNHPERGLGPHKTVTERLSEHAARHLSARNLSTDSPRLLVQGKSQSVPLGSTSVDYTEFATQKQLCRTRSGASDNICSSKLSPVSSAPWEAKATEISDKHCKNFSKSHSTENISPEKFSNLLNVSQSNHLNMWPPNTLSANPCLQQRKKQQPITQKNTQVVPQEHDESTNLHRKLKRQLTLNPSGCDPRIFRATHAVSTNNSNSGIGLKVPNGHQTVSQHRMLGPSLSGPTSHHFTQWDLHQCVTRIASAPDSSRSWHVGPPTASSSEPHINLWPNQQRLPVLAAQDQRRRLHYHLSSIFPEDEVHTVMQLYPDETDPQRICAAILHMFPKM